MTTSNTKLKRVIISLFIIIVATTIMIFETYNENLTKGNRITFGLIYVVIIAFTMMFVYKKNDKN
jgi:hypothetical protein